MRQSIAWLVFLLPWPLLASAEPRKPVCAGCHPKETAAYISSAMGHSFSAPEPVPAGKVVDKGTGARIVTEWRNEKMFQHLSENGMTATYQINYQIGAGKTGHSYATRVDAYLLESPASYFRRYGWDVSPGFAGSELLDYNRVLTEGCLFCHSNFPAGVQGRRMQNEELAAITCERCHGDTSEHISHPLAANVVNPAKLPVRARDSVCEQCHLEGVARVVNPGKTLHDFKPGNDLESTLTIYVPSQTTRGITAVSQEEQLAASRCARESNGKLWCGTCHDPHGQVRDRKAEVRAICTSCHPVLSPASHRAHTLDCVSCHMPSRAPTDVAHAALTDHRILARTGETTKPAEESVSPALRAWRDPSPEIAQRNLALADLEASANPGYARLGEVAGELLNSLPPELRENDARVAAALGDITLAQGQPAEALPFFRRASELDPASGQYALYLGSTLAKNGNAVAAEAALRRAIQLDLSLERAYLELATLYRNQGKLDHANEVLNQYLKWNPQGLLVRLAKDGSK